MAGADSSGSLSPLLRCRLCGKRIQMISELFVTASGTAHIVCVERHGVDPLAVEPLSESERSRLIRVCWDHEVAVCGLCDRTYRLREMGADLVRDQYSVCPFCRVDLTSSIRQHIAHCAAVQHRDPQWQAATREVLARAHEMRKLSQQLRAASELARVESEVLKARARETAEAAHRAQKDAQRIKRTSPRHPPVTISCSLTREERDVLLADAGLSAAARIALYSAAVVEEDDPLQLVAIHVETARELRDASQRLGLRMVALSLTLQIRRMGRTNF